MIRILASRTFRHLFLAQVVALLGTGLATVALALVQFDSHTDTWDSYFAGKRYSAGTPFRRAVEEELVTPAHSIQIGMRGSLFQISDISQSLALGYDVLTCDQIFELGVQAVADRIAARTAGRPCFITFDMDFVDPGSAPGVQTPESGGPTSREEFDIFLPGAGTYVAFVHGFETDNVTGGPGAFYTLLAWGFGLNDNQGKRLAVAATFAVLYCNSDFMRPCYRFIPLQCSTQRVQ